LVRVYSGETGKPVSHSTLPAIFLAPIRPDIVSFVHTNIAKNKRQPYAVSRKAGHQTSAESWGTGRAVSRIPRVPGGGTHRAGQGAFGNMCRGGRMFAPTRIWRRWHRKVNINQKRYAVASAVAASGVPSLVLARGHRISGIPEVPLVISTETINPVSKTKAAVKVLKTIKAYEDVQKVIDSKHVRPGKGKMRNRRYVKRRGPLIVFSEKAPLLKAFRNIPGIEFCNVKHLNLLLLAPGGHLGRFVIWTKDAFERLDAIWGTQKKLSKEKHGYRLPHSVISNPDIDRLINSDEIQSIVNFTKKPEVRAKRVNPLTHWKFLVKLNPHAPISKENTRLAKESAIHKKTEVRKQRRLERLAKKEAKGKGGKKEAPKKGGKKPVKQ